MRLAPRSLLSQIALAMALVLLLAQGISFALLREERGRLLQAQIEGPAVSRVITIAGRIAAGEPVQSMDIRRGRLTAGPDAIVTHDRSDPELANRIRDAAAANGLAVREVRAALSDELPPDRRPPEARPDDPPGPAGDRDREKERSERFRSLLLSIQLADGRWVNAQLLVGRPGGVPVTRLAISTLAIFIALLVATFLVVARLTRPLRELTDAAERFGETGQLSRLEPRGPTDIQRAVSAFNAMGDKVTSLLEEKDRMLGAIGHDLRTPLASLRIRAETMEPEAERERMIATLEEMAVILEDTLSLARSGRSSEAARAVDVTALVDTIAEEFQELGSDVTMADSPRAVAQVRANLLRRAVRNLVDNAVKYAGAAELSVASEADCVVIEIADRGPGIPEDQLDAVQEPFVRLEASRSRSTGGSGLGITLARAAAQLHGGRFELTNREGGGLSARLILPQGAR